MSSSAAMLAAQPTPTRAMCIPAPSSSLKPALTIKASQLAKAHHRVQVPRIIITPPDEPARFSSALPEQTYEKSVLFVPVKTEELGWDEHGLYWNGTYAYPVHQIYDKEGSPIGRRRKGPQGYRFEEYYGNKKPRRPSTSSHMDDTVEEASVRLEEPAPARIQGYNRASTSGQDEQEHIEKPAECDEDEAASPTSPTLSVASDLTETEDSSSVCDDSSSLWSRSGAASDDAESECTSPGVMSPRTDAEEGELSADALSAKLSDLAPTERVSKTTWTSLGTLPSSIVSPSRSSSLPEPSSRNKLDLSNEHRSSSTMIVSSPTEQRRYSTPSAYSSIIQDLVISPFAKQSASPLRSATLPRSRSRSSHAASKPSSVLRPPPPSSWTSSGATRSSSATRSSRRSFPSAPESDFDAGWNFEAQGASLSHHWDHSFANHY
ncbi:hypothetical protein PANT_10c00033 [Moesziomyces antarcticus T-34]|uniref:Uncharacterized protein n=1 Tax=Pseudozyma antarctica (strain T-34) TaxID=1151754 RepID=M9M240_PSEA3|nr:hypothetical protein PANT_10c00033 [Moesziomyces antarcticus T-34]